MRFQSINQSKSCFRRQLSSQVAELKNWNATTNSDHRVLSLALNDTALQIVTMSNLYYECFRLNKPDSSLLFLNQAIELSKKHSKSYNLSGLYRFMSGRFRTINNSDSAILFLNKSYEIDLKNNNLRGQAAYFKLFSEILYEQKKYKSSLKMVEN